MCVSDGFSLSANPAGLRKHGQVPAQGGGIQPCGRQQVAERVVGIHQQPDQSDPAFMGRSFCNLNEILHTARCSRHCAAKNAQEGGGCWNLWIGTGQIHHMVAQWAALQESARLQPPQFLTGPRFADIQGACKLRYGSVGAGQHGLQQRQTCSPSQNPAGSPKGGVQLRCGRISHRSGPMEEHEFMRL